MVFIVKFRINRILCVGSVRKPNLPRDKSVSLFLVFTIDTYESDFYSTFPRDGVARNPLSDANSVDKLINNFTEVNRQEPRVLRGGTWVNSAYFVRVSCRDGVLPWFTFYSYGFRCVRDK